jgi:hypothetical protein
MSFVPAFPWRRFVLAMWDRLRAYQNEIAIFAFSVTAKDFSHSVLLDREDRRFFGRSNESRETEHTFSRRNRYSYVAPRETRVCRYRQPSQQNLPLIKAERPLVRLRSQTGCRRISYIEQFDTVRPVRGRRSHTSVLGQIERRARSSAFYAARFRPDGLTAANVEHSRGESEMRGKSTSGISIMRGSTSANLARCIANHAWLRTGNTKA